MRGGQEQETLVFPIHEESRPSGIFRTKSNIDLRPYTSSILLREGVIHYRPAIVTFCFYSRFPKPRSVVNSERVMVGSIIAQEYLTFANHYFSLTSDH